jgi:hypothetical protein
VVSDVRTAELFTVTFPLKEYATEETANGVESKVRWRGSSVLALEPKGARVPLDVGKVRALGRPTPLGEARYP